MQRTDVPTLIPLPFANSGSKRAVPTLAASTVAANQPSLELGFPSATMIPRTAGGVPPAGQDFNGIFNLLSAANRWAQAGGLYPYNSTFSASIGGYPKGALLLSSNGTRIWQSSTEGNTTDPDGASASGWFEMSPSDVKTVKTIADLRAYSKTARPQVQVMGYWSVGDGAGGFYRLDATDTTSVDNGGTVIVGSDGGRWKLRHNGVIHLRQFGAKGDGTTDDAARIQACFTAAIALGYPVKILMWGKWLVGSPLTFPACSNLTLEGGLFTHTSSFSTTGHTFEFNGSAARSAELIHIDGVSIDCNYRGGGIKIDNGFKVTLSRCHVKHFRTRGYWIKESAGAHEVFLSNCWAMEYTYDDGTVAYTGPWYGTGVDVEPNDCKIDGLVSYFTGTPLRVDSQYNLVTNSHIGTGTILFTANSSFCRVSDCYIDMGMLVVENPWHIKIQNNQFLHATSDASKSFIQLKPLDTSRYVYGVDISGNSFQNNGSAVMNSISVDNSSGAFLASEVRMCDISRNSFTNTTVRTTRQRKRLFQAASTSYVVTADQFPFGFVQHVVANFAPATAGATVATGISVSANTVTMKLATSLSGVAHVEMDCNVE